MPTRSLRAIWAERRPVLNGWLSMPDPFGAEMLSIQGDDVVRRLVDRFHPALEDPHA
jgi:4-hydroxy-2-oxoheptanedioate aldolase